MRLTLTTQFVLLMNEGSDLSPVFGDFLWSPVVGVG